MKPIAFFAPGMYSFSALKIIQAVGNGPNTTRRKQERLIDFFEFCIGNDWLDKNPALTMKKAEEKRVPTDYFTSEEFKRTEDATFAYAAWRVCVSLGRIRVRKRAPNVPPTGPRFCPSGKACTSLAEQCSARP